MHRSIPSVVLRLGGGLEDTIQAVNIFRLEIVNSQVALIRMSV